jgi:hypothetical protein
VLGEGAAAAFDRVAVEGFRAVPGEEGLMEIGVFVESRPVEPVLVE